MGQALFGDAFAPGSFASLFNEKEIHLFFPVTHLSNLLTLLTQKRLALFLEVEDGNARRGGIMSGPPA
ncbi:MAG: hypothetical protein M3505_01495 [Verrucomicrobiota bacterium]|nr:hypothetical protein [Verrucomicrobiota bacterium]